MNKFDIIISDTESDFVQILTMPFIPRKGEFIGAWMPLIKYPIFGDNFEPYQDGVIWKIGSIRSVIHELNEDGSFYRTELNVEFPNL